MLENYCVLLEADIDTSLVNHDDQVTLFTQFTKAVELANKMRERHPEYKYTVCQLNKIDNC